MRAGDVMTTDVVTVGPGTSVAELAKLMLERRISGVPVVDVAGSLVGLVSEGDLMRRAELVTGRRPLWADSTASAEESAKAYVKTHGLKVGDIMTTDVVTIDEHEPLDRIAMLFEARGIKRAPVLRDGKIVGIVSRANILQGLAAGTSGGIGPDDSAIRAADPRGREGGCRRARLAGRCDRGGRRRASLGQRRVGSRTRCRSCLCRNDRRRSGSQGPSAGASCLRGRPGAGIEQGQGASGTIWSRSKSLER